MASAFSQSISTNVPSSGRQRRMGSDVRQQHLPGDQQPPYAVRDVARRERRARDVLDVLVEPKRGSGARANELAPPVRIANLPAIGFAIFEDLEPADTAVATQRQRVGDEIMLADHPVAHEPAGGAS